MYDLRFGRSLYAWRSWVWLKLDSDKMNMEGWLTLKAASHWASTHGQMKTYSHWCGHWKMIFYLIIVFTKTMLIYAIAKITFEFHHWCVTIHAILVQLYIHLIPHYNRLGGTRLYWCTYPRHNRIGGTRLNLQALV
jgi:hypothetical protein